MKGGEYDRTSGTSDRNNCSRDITTWRHAWQDTCGAHDMQHGNAYDMTYAEYERIGNAHDMT